jgi:hypothetical protein
MSEPITLKEAVFLANEQLIMNRKEHNHYHRVGEIRIGTGERMNQVIACLTEYLDGYGEEE